MKNIEAEIPPDQAHIIGFKKKEGAHTIIDIIKDLFYGTGQSMYQIFRRVSSSNLITQEQFVQLINSLSNNQLPEADLISVFSQISRDDEKSTMTFQQFEVAFSQKVFKAGQLQHETEVIK